MTPTEHRTAVANLLLDLPEDGAFSSTSGQAFVTLPIINQTFALSDPILQDWFRDRYYRANGQPLSGHDLHQTLATLRARAHFNARRFMVGIRATGTPSAIYIDLCNNDSESVSITKDGWEVTKPEVTFQHTRGQLPLPRPETTNDERATTNALLDWLLSALQPTGPYPILILHGPPSSGKTALAKSIRSLIDPVTAPLLPLPSRAGAITKLALRHRVLAFDHVTRMSPTVTDALCRISTGVGVEAADNVQLEIARPIIITTPRNGIGDWIPRPDLAARCITVQLPTEIQLPTPAALYTALSSQFTNDTRATNYEPRATISALSDSSAHADPLFAPLLALPQTTGEWTGTATDLLNEICVTAPVTCSTPRALSQRLTLLTPALQSSSLAIEHHRAHAGRRLITLRQSPRPSEPRAPATGSGILEFQNSRILEFLCSTISTMQRLSATLLLVLFSFFVIEPTVFADDPDSKLPACCRKSGKHHCAMPGETPSGIAVTSVQSKCPNFPGTTMARVSGRAGAASPAQVFFAAILSHPAAQAQTEARYRVSFSRSQHKRGPPSLLS